MWEAREELAINKDVAPGRLVPDLAIVAAVKAMPKSKSELASLKTFSGRASRTYIDLWWEAFTLGNTTKNVVELRLKATGIPNHRNWPLKFPDANARLIASKSAIADLSDKKQIPAENILSPDILRSICFEPPSPLDDNSIAHFLREKKAREWQIELLLPLLLKTLTAKPAVVTESPDPSE